LSFSKYDVIIGGQQDVTICDMGREGLQISHKGVT